MANRRQVETGRRRAFIVMAGAADCVKTLFHPRPHVATPPPDAACLALSSTLAILRCSCRVAEGVCNAIPQTLREFLHVGILREIDKPCAFQLSRRTAASVSAKVGGCL